MLVSGRRARRALQGRAERSDDGNPSFADWVWQIERDGAGSQVTVTVDLNPLTFWRKNLLIKIRRRGLQKEMHASLTALQSAVAS